MTPMRRLWGAFGGCGYLQRGQGQAHAAGHAVVAGGQLMAGLTEELKSVSDAAVKQRVGLERWFVSSQLPNREHTVKIAGRLQQRSESGYGR